MFTNYNGQTFYIFNVIKNLYPWHQYLQLKTKVCFFLTGKHLPHSNLRTGKASLNYINTVESLTELITSMSPSVSTSTKRSKAVL